MATAGNRSPGWWYPWLFVGGLGIVVIVNGILVYFATNSWTGLSTDGHYDKGLAYNQTLDAQRQQDALGWKVDFNYDPNGNLSVKFIDANGAPLDGLTVTANLYRPSQDNVDYGVALQPAPLGSYQTQLQLPLPGLWEVRLNAVRGSDTFRLRRRIQVP
ncbi:MAG: FixH family protein [Rhodospirillaceae bacterium]|nr:FixH family protein [Rhodospirillaceae bacterium]